jgi:hypothetical protein
LSGLPDYSCFENFDQGTLRYCNSTENKFMRDVMELLRAKEQELVKVKRQVEALRIAAPLLGGDQDQATPSNGPAMVRDSSHLG